jgi:hypothetical protein
MTTAPRTTRRIPMIALLPLCLAFAGGAAAGSHDVAMHGPNGNGGSDCDQPAATAPEAANPKPVPTPAPAVKRSNRVKPVVSVRSGDGDDSSGHTPRWHSFLPGMFR